jgi:hypothetical protein
MRKRSAVIACLAALSMLLCATPAYSKSATGTSGGEQRTTAEGSGALLAASLFHCTVPDYYPPGYTWETCTVITNAPASGVQVLDRSYNKVVTLYNGNTVYLGYWLIDQSGRCGINGDPYVWVIWWRSPTSAAHWAYIGDWYLATGSASTWKPFPLKPNDPRIWGNEGGGTVSGACNVI